MQTQTFQIGQKFKSYYTNGNIDCTLQVVAVKGQHVYYQPNIAIGVEARPISKTVEAIEKLIASKSWIPVQD